jgi:hypothetical protein
MEHLDRISPSKFMRELRPECYSDTEDHVAYLLDAPTLEYHVCGEFLFVPQSE